MTRWKLVVEYDGRPFVGWQRQDNGPSVQQAVEEAVRRFCGETPTVQAAGRTDTGVHAFGQVAHVDISKDVSARAVRDAVNFHLRPLPVAILSAEPAGSDFHARLSARQRGYLYRISNRRAPPALDRGRVWHVQRPLDVEAMQGAARVLVGHHDFTSFRASLCQAKSPVKTLDRFDVTRDGDEVRVVARARSFLHHQVRNMVGTIVLVGEGRWTAAAVRRALDARDRSAAGPTAPPDGLYFTDVVY